MRSGRKSIEDTHARFRSLDKQTLSLCPQGSLRFRVHHV